MLRAEVRTISVNIRYIAADRCSDHRNIVLSVHGICILDAGTRAASRTQRAVISLAKRELLDLR